MNKAWMLLALLLAGPAFGNEADGQRIVGVRGETPKGDVVGGMASDTTFRILRINSSGQASVIDAARDRDGNVLFQDAIPTTALAYNAACSTAVLNTHDLAHSVLYLRAFIGGGVATAADTTNIGILCIQVRGHLNGQADSSSTFVFYPAGTTEMGVSSAEGDSISAGHLIRGSRIQAWSGEYTVRVAANRQSHGSAIAINGRDYYFPGNTFAIPLDNLLGRNWWSPYTSIRIRYIGPSATGVAVQAHLVGTPL